ncbi:PTS cellobiose transporter subunit IIA [Macrococcus bovicus]|uniref:PTS cellobiose transporter subunit IIA n=1 Tax=Macrococcus bovicus TaxID=69968 RepID=UPI0025A5EA3F|nr:PTS cellobiose transporter subunit IIA [Macrococcus bovicus]WJP97369.1 PTS cellobiose transporter subunit IIA [Macrococcus bovicus]
MSQEELQMVAFQIILHSGNSRTLVHESFQAMRANDFAVAEQKLEESNKELTEAHKVQTSLLQQYASGEEIKIEIIMVHAQDHLMTTMTLREMAVEMLHLYRRINNEQE